MHDISVSSCEFSYDPNDKSPDSHEATESDHGPIIWLDIEYAIKTIQVSRCFPQNNSVPDSVTDQIDEHTRLLPLRGLDFLFALAIGIDPDLPGVFRAGSSSRRVLHAIGPGVGVMIYLSIRP